MIESTKELKRDHGFGLAEVRRIIKQLNGDYTMNYSDNLFDFVTEIPVE